MKLGHDQRERAHQHGKRHGGLRHDAEFDPPLNEQGRHQQHRYDLDHVVVAGGEEAEVAVDADDDAEIGDQILELPHQAGLDPALVMQQRDGFGPLAHMNQARAEHGLLVELLVVEID